jgi:hypothetical protein
VINMSSNVALMGVAGPRLLYRGKGRHRRNYPFASCCLRSSTSRYGSCWWDAKIESAVRYLGIEVDDALAIAEQVDV